MMEGFQTKANGSDRREAGPQTLLVGTALSVRQLHHALQASEPAPTCIGCLLPATAAEASQSMPLPILGPLDKLETVLADHPVDQVLLSLPLAMREQTRSLAAALDRLGVAWRFLPTLGDQLAGRTSSRLTGGLPVAGGDRAQGAAAPVDPRQLIDRPARPLDEQAIGQCLRGRTVMVTGAGGSIGAELARTVCRFQPRRIVLLERTENALFEIDRELDRIFPDLPRQAVLHDVTDAARTHTVVGQHQPDVIFHAAAHKHVPLMQDHPAEAVENNFYGTRAMAEAADAHGVERFVMISTDKAVNPSSVMGASKRLAELYIQHLAEQSQTTFAMVRFGNVLGSACSVLPIWSQQLAQGGPITVTDPGMYRYFMTIPEAAGLVLQAGALSHGGEVFLLDMDEPISVLALAKRFVRQQGFEPGVDVSIEFTGPRPGEKLVEVLAYDSEDMAPTEHEAIHMWRTSAPDAARMQQIIDTFDRLRNPGLEHSPWHGASREAILNALRWAVPEMVTAVAS
jgi:FlaA1/EpsC-like NDP-sugar epimerase